jgi:hypothetical protein
MKTKTLTLAFLAGIFFIQSCKKEDDGSTTKPAVTVNEPPASNYIYGSLFTSFSTGTALKSNWTTDGKEFFAFTDEFTGWSENVVNICGDRLVLSYSRNSNQYVAAFAPLNDLKHFTKVNSSRMMSDVALINGVVVATASDGNNFYRGSCDTKAGESEMSFQLLPASTIFNQLQLMGNLLICNVQTGGGQALAYTLDGINWTITNEPSSGCNYYYFDGKIWAISYNTVSTNAGTDLSTGWTTVTLNSLLNNSDTSGSFYPALGRIIPRSSDWLLYGSISSTSTGIHYPCVNRSTDQGQTWTTIFLTGIAPYTNNSNWSGQIASTNSVLILDIQSGNTVTDGIYSSSNGLDFTLWNDAAQIDKYHNFFSPRGIW